MLSSLRCLMLALKETAKMGSRLRRICLSVFRVDFHWLFSLTRILKPAASAVARYTGELGCTVEATSLESLLLGN